MRRCEPRSAANRGGECLHWSRIQVQRSRRAEGRKRVISWLEIPQGSEPEKSAGSREQALLRVHLTTMTASSSSESSLLNCNLAGEVAEGREHLLGTLTMDLMTGPRKTNVPLVAQATNRR